METVTLKMPTAMVAAAGRLARARDVTPGQVLRDALAAEIRRASRNATPPNRAEEQLLAPIRALVAADFGEAHNWDDLTTRLRAKGYALREAGGGLALHSHPDGQRLCKASELGHAYGALMRRFGAPFPGHAHRHLAQRLLGAGHAAPDMHPVDDVIERY